MAEKEQGASPANLQDMATKAYVDTAIAGIQNIGNTSSLTVKDTDFTIQDDGNTTKQTKFELSGITAGQTRTLTIPDATTTLVGTNTIQTLTNKTISGTSNTLTNIPRPVVPEVVSTTASSSLTLTTASSTYVYTGTSTATWTLPAISSNTGVVFKLLNRGTNIVTVQRAGSDTIYNIGTASTSMPLAPGATAILLDDGTYWYELAPPFSPAVTFDATGTAAYSSTANLSSISGSGTHTATAGATVFVIVYVMAANNGFSTWTRTATYKGISMTSVSVVNNSNVFGNIGWMEIFKLANAPGGSNTWNISISGGGSTINAVYADSVSYLNANYLSSGVTAQITSGSALATGTLPSGANHMMLQAFGIWAQSSVALSAYNQTSRYYTGNVVDANGDDNAFLMGDAAGSLSGVSFSATSANAGGWVSTAIDLSPTPQVYVKSTSIANSTSVTLPTHAVGDIIIIFAYRSASTTTPTKPTASGTVPAWVDIDNNLGANTNSSRTAYFVATATNHTSGTWTNASCMIAVVLTGQNGSSPIGGHAESGGASSTSCVSPAITMSNTSGSSVLLSFFGCAGAGNYTAPPSGYNAIVSPTTLGTVNLKLDSTSDGSYTQTAQTAGVYRAATIEIIV